MRKVAQAPVASTTVVPIAAVFSREKCPTRVSDLAVALARRDYLNTRENGWRTYMVPSDPAASGTTVLC